jgi:intracellular sulfur oxidation DsrE/DsrF family protein
MNRAKPDPLLPIPREYHPGHFHPGATAMQTSTRRSILRIAAMLPLAAISLTPAFAFAQTAAGKKHRLVIQVTDNDPARWVMVLNNTKNAQVDVGGADKIDIEIVTYGPGINMVKGGSPVADRIAELVQSGVKVVGCENTMANLKLTKAEMLPTIGYVPAGVTELMKKQEEGWAYLRP